MRTGRGQHDRSSLAIRRTGVIQLDGWSSWPRGRSSSAIRRAGRVVDPARPSAELDGVLYPPFNKTGITSATGMMNSDLWHWKANSKLYFVSKDGLHPTMGRSLSIAKHLIRLCNFIDELLLRVCRESFRTEIQFLDLYFEITVFDPNNVCFLLSIK